MYESSRGTTRPLAHQLSVWTLDLLLCLLFSITWSVGVYSAVPYYYTSTDPYAFLFFLFVLFLDAVLGVALVKVLCDFKDTIGGIVNILAFFSLLALLLGNYFVRFPQFPSYWRWAWWGNPLQHSFGALLIGEISASPLYDHWDRSTLIAYGYWLEDDAGKNELVMEKEGFAAVVATWAVVVGIVGIVVLSMRRQ